VDIEQKQHESGHDTDRSEALPRPAASLNLGSVELVYAQRSRRKRMESALLSAYRRCGQAAPQERLLR
jgi:hypothetical protein